jgi:hypothetical protein
MTTQPANHEPDDWDPDTGTSTQLDSAGQGPSRLTVDELLRRARPLPPHEEMVIEGITQEEGAAFLAALDD